MNEYEMYTDEGNAAVHAIACMARRENWTWSKTENALHKLATIPGFSEAGDTAVREAVYVTIN